MRSMLVSMQRLATLLAVILGLFVASARGATVISVGMLDLVDGSDFIFHGAPVESWVAVGSRPDDLVTNVRFRVSEVIKGDQNRQYVVLQYLGGTQGRIGVRIEGLRLPVIGEEGIYFVEQLNRRQVHPLLGWDQGLFRVSADARGTKRVFTFDMRPVRRIDSVKASPGISTGHAPGVVLASDESGAMTVADFKSRLRQMVEARQ